MSLSVKRRSKEEKNYAHRGKLTSRIIQYPPVHHDSIHQREHATG